MAAWLSSESLLVTYRCYEYQYFISQPIYLVIRCPVETNAGHSLQKCYKTHKFVLQENNDLLFRVFYNPPIIHIFEDIACDLLLMTASPSICISYRVYMGMRVEPAGSTWDRIKGVTQCDLGTKCNIQRLSFGQCGQSSLQYTHIISP